MKFRRWAFLLVLIGTACGVVSPVAPTATPVPPTIAPEPTAVPATLVPAPEATTSVSDDDAPPVALPSVYRFAPPEGVEIVYDFSAHLCEATWTNNGLPFPCPGDPAKTDLGYAALIELPQLGNIVFDNTAILAIPAHDGQFLGWFGRFPDVAIETGDMFYSAVTCLNENCDVEFALGYYSAMGTYGEMLPAWPYKGSRGPMEISISLDPMADQMIGLVLVVRTMNPPAIEQAVWIEPVVWRAGTP